MSQLFRVGLTGNIASGKSTVADAWRGSGAHIIDADVLARAALAAGSPGEQRVLQLFGTVDRTELRAIVFRDAGKRQQLEAIVHPEVARLRAERESALAAQGARIVVNDIPLLFEVGLENEFDVIVLVDAPRVLRIDRIVHNRKIDRAEAERMVDAQMPAEQKRPRADFVIDNDGSINQLRSKAEQVWRQIQARASA